MNGPVLILAMWSAKGGVGLSVTAAATALMHAQEQGTSILIDLMGDQAAILGMAEPSSPGVYDWLRSAADSPESIQRLEVDSGTGVGLVPPGVLGDSDPSRVAEFVDAIAGLECPVVVDCGVLSPRAEDASIGSGGEARTLLVEAICSVSRPVLVSSPCYMALRRAVRCLRSDGLAATLFEGSSTASKRNHSSGSVDRRSSRLAGEPGLVVVSDPGRALDASDVASITQLPLLGHIERDPTVARRVDSGQFLRRPPRTLLRSLEGLCSSQGRGSLDGQRPLEDSA